MRINVPVGTDISGLEAILREEGVELVWFEPIEDEIVQEQREIIVCFTGNDVPGETVIERSTGEFLAVDRFFSAEAEDGKGLVYGVQKRMTPAEFYKMIGTRASGPCTADDIADHLVKAFDYGVAGDLGLASALFVYVAPDGRMVHQHST
jgi:hypothetical protein